MTHRIHAKLPSGFTLANVLQRDEYDRTGSVNGASKVCFVSSDLAVRLRPPRRWGDVISPIARSFAFRIGLRVSDPDNFDALCWYIQEYDLGWKAARRSSDSKAWDSGMTSAAWDDGYLDGAAGRARWHNTYCTDHDNCKEG